MSRAVLVCLALGGWTVQGGVTGGAVPATGATGATGVTGATRGRAPPGASRTRPAAPDTGDLRELRERLERILDDPALARAHVGLVVQVAETGEILFDRNGDRRFTAASTTKLVTAAVALERLGPDHRWRTLLAAGGPVRDGVLEGDLWIVGGGDPVLGREEVRGWPRLLRDAGVRRIRGDLVGDDRAFPDAPWGRGWMWDELHAGWASGVTGLHMAPGRIGAELLPGPDVGDPASFRVTDSVPPPPVLAHVGTGAPDSETRLRFVPPPGGGGPVRLEGWIPAGDTVRLTLAPGHPTLHLLRFLESALPEAGISLDGESRRPREGERAPAGGWRLERRSRPLEEVLPRLLKPSDNRIAETLLRTLGRERGRSGSAEEGLEVVAETLSGWGIEGGAVSLADGSGLSRYDEIAPRALTRLLRRVRQLPHGDLFTDALPRAGEDGTLARRLLSTAAEDNLRAKTGSLSSVRGLAGYVIDRDGETLVFALLLNGYDAPGRVAVGLEDLLVEQLALYHGRDYPGCPCR